ncbi:MAG: serine hydrolase [Thermoleophilia bacterium]
MNWRAIIPRRGNGITSPAIFIAAAILLLALAGFVFAVKNGDEQVDTALRDLSAPGPDADSRVSAGIVAAWKPHVPQPATTREELIDQLYQLTEATPGTYGIYIYEFDTAEGFGINADLRFEAASTNKVPILVKLYKEIELGSVSRDEVMTYFWADHETGTGSIQTTGIGSQWTIAELAEKMIKESDNVAKNMLFRRLGYYEVEAFAASHGSDFDIYSNQTSPRDMANLLRLIYQNGIVGPELSGEMIGLMVETDFEDRLPRYLNDVAVANKVGTWGDSINDVGIVLHEERPFVIAVYSRDTGSEAAAADTVDLIAAHIHAYEVNR